VGGIDTFISGEASGRSVVIVILLAFGLGLRHASDPDHLVAVSTLVADRRDGAVRAAARLGAFWGLGHGATLLACGVPALILRGSVPRGVERSSETAIGLIIIVLAVRLLVRWRRGTYHLHAHAPDSHRHMHLHPHTRAPHTLPPVHRHDHVVRSPRQAFSIGLVHGVAGSGGVAILLITAIPTIKLACAALVIFVAGCAVSMSLLSAVVGGALRAVDLRFTRAIPALGMFSLLFGAWYLVAALASY
jgi:ABC-type nickel/cobalt efflux system permease component RcnA